MKTAVLFKVHFWDETVENLYRKCKLNSVNSDFFIVCDNSSGKNFIPPHIFQKEKVFFVPYSNIEKIGLEWGDEEWNLGGYWFNGDYHQNLFFLEYPDYDYICSVESDVLVRNNIDAIFSDMKNRGIHVVYKEEKDLNKWWIFTDTCKEFYNTSKPINRGLFCISFFSRVSLALILKKRMEMSYTKRENKIKNWPIGEAVMAEEIFHAGLKSESLSFYCDSLDYYEYAPCYLEKEVEDINGRTFIHPVSSMSGKFVKSNFNNKYVGLISDESVNSGKTFERIKKINEIEIYSRLYYHFISKNNFELSQKTLNIARENLESIDKVMVANDINTVSKNIIRDMRVEKYISDIVSSPLPTYDKSINISFENGITLSLDVPSDKNFLVLSARDENLYKKLNVYIHKNEDILFFNDFYIVKRGEMVFFVYKIEVVCDKIFIEQSTDERTWVNYIRFIHSDDSARNKS